MSWKNVAFAAGVGAALVAGGADAQETNNPVITFQQVPLTWSGDTTPTFKFSCADESKCTMYCRLVGGEETKKEFQRCNKGDYTFSLENQGAYAFSVYGIDEWENMSPTVTETFFIDTTGPSALLSFNTIPTAIKEAAHGVAAGTNIPDTRPLQVVTDSDGSPLGNQANQPGFEFGAGFVTNAATGVVFAECNHQELTTPTEFIDCNHDLADLFRTDC